MNDTMKKLKKKIGRLKQEYAEEERKYKMQISELAEVAPLASQFPRLFRYEV